MRSGRFGDGEKESAALAEFALYPDFAAVGLDDVFDDGEAEAGAALVAGAGAIDAVETFEDAALRFGRNAGAVVGDGDGCTLRIGFGGDSDGAAGRAVFDAVVDEVVDDLFEAIRIDV